MKKIISVLLVVILVFAMASCGKTETALGGTRKVTNRFGEEFTLPENLKKIISLSPSVTQVLVDVGMEDALVAVDHYSLPNIKNKDLPTFDIMNPDIEVLANLDAQVVLSTSMSQKGGGEDPLNPLRDLGIEVVYVSVGNTIEEIQQDVIFVGDIVNRKTQAEKLIETMDETIEEYRKIGESIENKKTVYFEISSAPNMYSFGSGVYLNEMLEIVGAENIFREETGWISVAPEAVVAANPDVIITNVDYEENSVADMKKRPGFDETTAVKNDEVVLVGNETSSYSNHNITIGLAEIAQAVYPQEFGK